MTFSSTSATATCTELNCAELNKNCQCIHLDKKTICAKLEAWDSADLCSEIIEQRPHLFAESSVFVSEDNLHKQQEIIAAVERVIALPEYQELVLSYAPATARCTPKAHGVFFGYDFHLSPTGPQLIEINSNAGGALLNAIMMSGTTSCSHLSQRHLTKEVSTPTPEQLYFKMFMDEWRAERDSSTLRCIAIVDANPQEQYLFPEFLLFKRMFERNGLDAVICAPSDLCYHEGKLWYGQKSVDLVYNRLTDFSLEAPEHQQLCNAYMAGAVVVTPHPRSHALYADKRNLEILTSKSALSSIGADDATIVTLIAGIAHTVQVNSNDADALWQNRKQLFFKPAKGYGSKATYRGDKITRRVFNEILQNNYVAQTLVPPSKRYLHVNNEIAEFKFDLRMYVYQGETQQTIARLYQGQTTNFRTPGGGFARIEVIR